MASDLTPVVRLPGTRKTGLFRYDGEKWVEVDAAAELRNVEAQRDELLEALKELVRLTPLATDMPRYSARLKALDAITKAEGGE